MRAAATYKASRTSEAPKLRSKDLGVRYIDRHVEGKPVEGIGRDIGLKSSTEFRNVEKKLLDLLYSPAG